jgi:hypothetical protein
MAVVVEQMSCSRRPQSLYHEVKPNFKKLENFNGFTALRRQA